MLHRWHIPPRDKKMSARIRELAEEAKVAIRNVRRDANDHIKRMKKASEISEDDEKHAEAETQKLTDGAIARVDDMLKKKEAEILHV